LTEKTELFNSLKKKVADTLRGRLRRDEKLRAVCRLLKGNVSYYDWVGFYLVDKTRSRELVLGPYEGEPTEHTRIPFGTGVCGQAAERKQTFLVQDVSKETNYLSCSKNVKSEIVVPLLRRGAVVGELDVDSHEPSPFTEEDEAFLKRIAEMTSNLL